MKMKQILMATLACYCAAAMADDDRLYWFKNEAACGPAKVTIRSHCLKTYREGASRQRNNGCPAQEVLIAQPGKKPVKQDLLKFEPLDDDFHMAESMQCLAVSGRHYLVFNLSTGGSCDTCAVSGVMSLDGRWRNYGERWMATSKAEQRAIEQAAKGLRDVPEYEILNVVPDDERGRK